MVKINPVKATYEKYKNSGCEMADINNTCYNICGAFSFSTDPYDMDPECTKICDEYVEQRRHDIYGVGHCDHQGPFKPVIWHQVPNFVPELIRKGATPEQALQQGLELCAKQVPLLVNECQDKCRLHYSAIEPYTQSSQPQKKKPIQTKSVNIKKLEKENPNYFWISVVVTVILLFALIMFFR